MFETKLIKSIKACTKCEKMDCSVRSVAPIMPRNWGKHAVKIMLVGFNPSSYESVYHLYMSGDTGNLVWNVLDHSGLNQSNVYATTIIKGFLPERKPTLKYAKECGNRYLVRELVKYDPNFLIVFGAEAFKALFGSKVKFSSCVNRVIKLPWFNVLPMYSPSYFDYVGLESTQYDAFTRTLHGAFDYAQSQKEKRACSEIESLKSLILEPEPVIEDLKSTNNQLDPYTFVEYASGNNAIHKFRDMIVKAKSLSFDIETYHLKIDIDDPLVYLVSVGICDEKYNCLSVHTIDLKPKQIEQLWRLSLWALKNKPIIGHHLKFDAKPWAAWLAKYSVKWFDTLILAYLVNELELDYSLKKLAQRVFNIIDYGIEFSAEHTARDVDPRELRVYNCRDVYWTRRLCEYFWPKLTKEQQYLYNTILSDLILSFSFMEINGLPFNEKLRGKCRDYVQSKITNFQFEIDDYVFDTLKFVTEKEHFNVKSPKDVRAVIAQHKWNISTMETTPTGLLSTDSDNFAKFLEANAHKKRAVKFASLILGQVKYRTILSKFDGKNALIKYMLPDGRVHTNWNMTTARTGRPSTNDPNVLNAERKDRLPLDMQEKVVHQPRHQYKVRKGKIIVGMDLSQAELRVLTCESKDKSFFKTYMSGGDAHNDTGMGMAKVVGLNWDDAKEWLRQVAKNINFGKAYQQGPKGTMDQLNKNFAEQGMTLRLSYDQSCSFHEAWNADHRRAYQWLESIKEFAEEYGYTETFLGRRRHFIFKDDRRRNAQLREAVNLPIQGGAAHLTDTIVNRTRIAGANRIPGYKLIKHEYDAVYNEVDEQYKDEMVAILKETTQIKIGDFGGFIIIPFVADISVGYSFATMEKLK